MAALLAVMVMLAGCGATGSSEADSSADISGTGDATVADSAADSSASTGGSTAPQTGADNAHPQVEITMADGGVIVLELDREAAPVTVDNFIALVNSGFYDGLVFHRIIDGFMIQGGAFDASGAQHPASTITGEFAANGWENPIKHAPGVVSMARSNDNNSASSQFFICDNDSNVAYLDGNYAAFGYVVEGMDVVERISQLPTDANDYPQDPAAATITSIRIVQ
ncbi:MAG: peptidylprolyl isomerase [Coriobacteriales bacterium]|jgi:peptidyl-prolyl cis-trans isomerase B (cyclophilin B)|nr:peptidylprolyl isomerase [Coriobacteriales bacterium]